MKFSVAAVLAAASGVSAHYGANATVITEVVDTYTTYCPEATQLTIGGTTWTITEATTLTITDCPCTITKPVTTSTEYVCHTCSAPVPEVTETKPAAPPAVETLTPIVAPPAGTGEVTPTKGAPTSVPTAGAGKVAALSGAGLAGFVGLAALVL